MALTLQMAAWLYRPITATFTRAADAIRNIQAGPLGLYLLYVLVAFVALLLIAPPLLLIAPRLPKADGFRGAKTAA